MQFVQFQFVQQLMWLLNDNLIKSSFERKGFESLPFEFYINYKIKKYIWIIQWMQYIIKIVLKD